MIAVPIVGSTQVSPGSSVGSPTVGVVHPSDEGAHEKGSSPLVTEKAKHLFLSDDAPLLFSINGTWLVFLFLILTCTVFCCEVTSLASPITYSKLVFVGIASTFIVNSALEVFPQESSACHSNCVVPVKLSAATKVKVPSGLSVSVPSSEAGGVTRVYVEIVPWIALAETNNDSVSRSCIVTVVFETSGTN